VTRFGRGEVEHLDSVNHWLMLRGTHPSPVTRDVVTGAEPTPRRRLDGVSGEKHVMPWRIEDEMKRIGANYVQAGLWRPFPIRDGNLITGQQNFSGAATAELLVEALGR
jgi:putative intracellular protease/amidase